MSDRFVPGLELSRRFYHEAVRPVLDDAVPGLAHAAARLGELLSLRLPRTFAGHPTGFAPADGDHVRHMRMADGPRTGNGISPTRWRPPPPGTTGSA